MSGKIKDILNEIDDAAQGSDEVSVGDVLDRIGHRGSGALLLIPGLLGVSPIGAIPTVPTLLGAIVVLLAAQIVIGKRRLWLPGFLRDRAVEDRKLTAATKRIDGAASWLDRWFGGRLTWATGAVAQRLAGALCTALACTIPPLELVPFAAAIPLGTIATFGLALVLKDGLLMVLAFAASAAAFAGAYMLMPL